MNCSKLTSVTIPNSVKSIGNQAFDGCNLTEVISNIKNPFNIYGRPSFDNKCTFNVYTFNKATLYVPVGTIDKYKSTEGWKDFRFIAEIGDTPPVPSKCEKPTISYSNGKLTFHSATEDAVCCSTIKDADINSFRGNEVLLDVTYNISVYATKFGYENSDTVTATLCWIDATPSMKGIDNTRVAEVRANAVLVLGNSGLFTILGAPEGSDVSVFNLSGQKVGSAKAVSESTIVSTTLQPGEVGIVKIGGKSVKHIVK